jgi:hypothetical protein
MEIHSLDANTSKAAVDFSTIDADGNPVGFKIENGNCGIYVNGRWACFTGETLVHTETGTIPIKNIVAGQKVWSYDLSKGQNGLSSVVKTMSSAAKQLVRVFIGNDTIQATTEHPFYANRQWTAAKDLRKGVNILLLSGLLGVVDSIAVIDTLVTTYNFEVAQTHNYFVGYKGVLVHNTCIAKGLQTYVKNTAKYFQQIIKSNNVYHRLTDVLEMDHNTHTFIAQVRRHIKNNAPHLIDDRNLAFATITLPDGNKLLNKDYYTCFSNVNTYDLPQAINHADPLILPSNIEEVTHINTNAYRNSIVRCDFMGNIGVGPIRNFDAERKILEKFRTELLANHPNATSATFKFNVTISTELFPCLSCTKLFGDFLEEFKGASITVITRTGTFINLSQFP